MYLQFVLLVNADGQCGTSGLQNAVGTCLGELHVEHDVIEVEVSTLSVSVQVFSNDARPGLLGFRGYDEQWEGILYVLVNGQKVDIPSYGVKVNDVISLKEKSRTNPLIEANFNGLVSFNVPYLEKDKAQFSAKLVREPMREELPIDVTEILAVELYSK